jgi:hypothetical protein
VQRARAAREGRQMADHNVEWNQEQRFGHVTLQTYLGETYSLDLHGTPNFVFRGALLTSWR